MYALIALVAAIFLTGFYVWFATRKSHKPSNSNVVSLGSYNRDIVIENVRVKSSGGRVSVFSGNRDFDVHDTSVIIHGDINLDADPFLTNVPPKARSPEEETADLERLKQSLQKRHKNCALRSQSNKDGATFILIKLDAEEFSFTHLELAAAAGKEYEKFNPRPRIPEIPKIPEIRMPWDKE